MCSVGVCLTFVCESQRRFLCLTIDGDAQDDRMYDIWLLDVALSGSAQSLCFIGKALELERARRNRLESLIRNTLPKLIEGGEIPFHISIPRIFTRTKVGVFVHQESICATCGPSYVSTFIFINNQST